MGRAGTDFPVSMISYILCVSVQGAASIVVSGPLAELRRRFRICSYLKEKPTGLTQGYVNEMDPGSSIMS